MNYTLPTLFSVVSAAVLKFLESTHNFARNQQDLVEQYTHLVELTTALLTLSRLLQPPSPSEAGHQTETPTLVGVTPTAARVFLEQFINFISQCIPSIPLPSPCTSRKWTNEVNHITLDSISYLATNEPLTGPIKMSGTAQTTLLCRSESDLFVLSVVNSTFSLTSTCLVPTHQAMHASDSSVHLTGTTIQVNSTHTLFISWNSNLIMERMIIRRAAPISIFPLVVENRQPTGSVSLISTTFEDGHHSDISPIIANRQTDSILIQSSSFRNITSDSSIPPSTPLPPAGKTKLLNTKTDHVEGVFYGTLTNDINLGGEFFFSNNTFLNTTHSNEDYTCPDGTCTSKYASASTYITIKNSIFSGCTSTTDDGGAIWVGSSEPGTLFVVDCQFQSCSSGGNGGAIHTINRQMCIRRNTFSNCHAGSFGGVLSAVPNSHEVEFSENTCTSCHSNIADTNYHVNEATGHQILHNNTFSVSSGGHRSDCLLVVSGTAQASNNIFNNFQRTVSDPIFANLVLHALSITSVLVFGNKFEWGSAFSPPWSHSNSPEIAIGLRWSVSVAFPLIDSTGFFLPASKKESVTTTRDDTSNLIITGQVDDVMGTKPNFTAPASPSNPYFSLFAKRTVILRRIGMDLKVAPIAFASISNGGTVLLSEVDFFVSTSTLTKHFITVTSSTLTIDTVKLSSLNLGSTSVVRMEGASTLIVTNSNFASISQSSAGGAFLSTNGASTQIITITGSTFDKVTSKGDGGVILAQLGTGSKLTVSSTTFSSCSSTGKGGALSIVLSSTGSFALQSGTLFSSCTATNGNAVFVQASSLSSAVTRTSMGFLGSSSITPTATLLNLYRGWNTANTTDSVPLILFFATMGSTGHANSSGKDGMMCGFSVYPCQTLAPVQTTLVSYGSKTGGTLNPITILLQTALPQSIPFSCGGHTATISGNTITLSNTGQFTTSSSSSSLTLSALTILFASSQTQPAISVSTGSIVVSGCTVGNGSGNIPVSFGTVSGGSLEMRGMNTMKLVSPSSPLFRVTSGTLQIGSGTTLTHSVTKRTSSLFDVSGGSTTITSLSVPSLALNSASSVFYVTNSASLSVSSTSFSTISNEGSGSVIHCTSTGTLSLSSVSFSSCNCGVDGKGRSVFVSRSSFSSGNVVMKSVSITKAGTLGSHEVFLEGQNVGAVVTSDWTSLIGANDGTLTMSKLDEVFGSDPTNTTNCGPLGYHLYPHASGAVFVSEGFWDHGKCGQERLPCSTLPFAFSLLTTTKTTLSLSASISSSSQKSLIFDLNGLFVVKAGPLAFSSMDLTIPTSLTKTLFVVKGSTLTLSNTVSITNPSSPTHSSSLFEVKGGSLTLSSTVFDFVVRFSSSSSLLAQTAGNLKLDTVSIGNVHRSDGDGSVVHSSLSTPDEELEIVGSLFSSCSSAGDGGCMAIAVEAGTLLISHSSFSRCSSADRGGALLLDFSNLLSFEHYKLDTVSFGRDEDKNTAGTFGNDVFVIGRDLSSQIEASQWEDSLTAAQQSDLMGSDSLTQQVESLLRYLVGKLVFVSSSGDDLNIGLKDSPFRTLAGLFSFVLKVEKVVVLGSASIGEFLSLGVGEEEGREVLIGGQGEDCSLRCDILPFAHQHGTPYLSFSMLSLQTYTLSLTSLAFTSFSAPAFITSVFSVSSKGILKLVGCPLKGSTPTKLSLVTLHRDGSAEVDDFTSHEQQFVGKGSVVGCESGSTLNMARSRFESTSFEGGCVVGGTCTAQMEITDSTFVRCVGTRFGSVIRVWVVGSTLTLKNSRFESCSTRVRLSEEIGKDGVVGGGCVVVELKPHSSSGTHHRSSVDLTLSSFTSCSLTVTDTARSGLGLVGGSGFLIRATQTSNTLSATLRNVSLTNCSITPLLSSWHKSFSGGVIVCGKKMLQTDRRGMVVTGCSMGTVEVSPDTSTLNQHNSVSSFTEDVRDEVIPLFLSVDFTFIGTITLASPLYLSLIDFIKKGNSLDDKATKRACDLICRITPSEDTIFSADRMLFQLVPALDGSCSGFTESVIQLLTSSNEELVETTFSFLAQIVSNADLPTRFDFLATDFFTLLPNTLYEQEIHILTQIRLSLMKISSCFIAFLPHDTSRQLCQKKHFSMDSFHQTFLDKFFHPVKPFLESIFRNRRQITFTKSKCIFSELLGRLVGYSPLLEQMTQFVLSSSFALTYMDCLDYFDLDVSLLALIGKVLEALRQWKKEDSAVQKRGRQIQTKLDEEGLPDEMELHLQCSGYSAFGLRIPSLGALLIEYIGGNAPL
ncbi:hypothetical protein BLNAU_12554 [Blattamonas nauphoetae]|uniref:Uncharacterized protein n=1 Tax=Blattamonas nauphoetae TaxID=2049346 RepID=A0ABQ9XJ47_9EUKA|nr:hypothetical protein BLNAU_12554 [Blattamonas nauphoetae]